MYFSDVLNTTWSNSKHFYRPFTWQNSLELYHVSVYAEKDSFNANMWWINFLLEDYISAPPYAWLRLRLVYVLRILYRIKCSILSSGQNKIIHLIQQIWDYCCSRSGAVLQDKQYKDISSIFSVIETKIAENCEWISFFKYNITHNLPHKYAYAVSIVLKHSKKTIVVSLLRIFIRHNNHDTHWFFKWGEWETKRLKPFSLLSPESYASHASLHVDLHAAYGMFPNWRYIQRFCVL